jgi:drug/metabolite transporter (DMT)-like permease
LFAALLYGSADFCGGLATRRNSMIAVTLCSQACGFILLLLVRPFFHDHALPSDYLFGALSGLCGGVGIALLYHALSVGKMGVVSPITAVLASAVPLTIGILRGERLSIVQIVGILAALVAIVMISFSTEEGGTREFATAGVKEAVASGVVLGGFLFFLSYTHRAAGLDNLVAARVASIAVLAAGGFVLRQALLPQKSDAPLVVLTGALDMTANALFVLATFNGYLSIAAVLTGLYPAGTVFLARVVLNERLRGMQKAGVGLALAGVLLIALR